MILTKEMLKAQLADMERAAEDTRKSLEIGKRQLHHIEGGASMLKRLIEAMDQPEPAAAADQSQENKASE
ncbi:MAG: hypothetical protein GC190_19380 [Alphaproteobacteria bacterium]|nr:hypothetical protein [Alphaproteobacteria bacterium]